MAENTLTEVGCLEQLRKLCPDENESGLDQEMDLSDDDFEAKEVEVECSVSDYFFGESTAEVQSQ